MNESSNKSKNLEKRKYTECPEKRRARGGDVNELTFETLEDLDRYNGSSFGNNKLNLRKVIYSVNIIFDKTEKARRVFALIAQDIRSLNYHAVLFIYKPR